MFLLAGLLLLVGGAYVTELIGRRRQRRISATFARMTPVFKGRRHPELDLEIAHVFGYGEIVWLMFSGTDATRLPPYLGFEKIGQHEAALGQSLAGWLRTLNAEVTATALADGWAASVGFESTERVGKDQWSYFK
jgi:hypothetical protein